MIVLDEYEKTVCRLAIQIFEQNERLGGDNVSNEEALDAEAILEDIVPRLEECIASHPRSFTELKRKLQSI